MRSGKEFKVNEFITLKLENNKTNIYVKGDLFKQCKYLAFNVPIEDIEDFDEIQSIDEMEQKDRSSGFKKLNISPEQEFWAHCSNLQVWFENDYDTRLLHSNLAFPLLIELTKIGDPLAKRVFKEEIFKRIESGYTPVIEYILRQKYLNFLSSEEQTLLFEKIIEYGNLEVILRLLNQGILYPLS